MNTKICIAGLNRRAGYATDRSKPIIALYLQIFATVTLKLTVAKIGKYGIMIGLLRSAEASQSEWGKMLRFATVEATSGRCLIYRVFGVWSVPRVDSNRWILSDAHCWKI